MLQSQTKIGLPIQADPFLAQGKIPSILETGREAHIVQGHETKCDHPSAPLLHPMIQPGPGKQWTRETGVPLLPQREPFQTGTKMPRDPGERLG